MERDEDYGHRRTFLFREKTMKSVNGFGIRGLLVGTITAALGLANAAFAADFTLDFPAGSACTFELRIDGTGGNQVYREFFDRNDNLVRSLTAGTGSALTFTNVDTGARCRRDRTARCRRSPSTRTARSHSSRPAIRFLSFFRPTCRLDRLRRYMSVASCSMQIARPTSR